MKKPAITTSLFLLVAIALLASCSSPSRPSTQEATDALKPVLNKLNFMSKGDTEELTLKTVNWGKPFAAENVAANAVTMFLGIQPPTNGSKVYPAEVEFTAVAFVKVNRFRTDYSGKLLVYFWRNSMDKLAAYPVEELK